jgi:hypothetical protein
MRKLGWALPFLALGLSGCRALHLIEPGVQGSGKVTEQSISIRDFDKIEMNGGGRVEIVVGKPLKLVVKTDDNVHPVLISRVRGETLKLDSKRMIAPTELSYVIHTPRLTMVESTGAVNGTITGISGRSFRLECNGASELKLVGSVGEFRVEANGASSINAFELIADEVRAESNGAGTLDLHATRKLTGEANGASSINYKGKPGYIKLESGGVGEIKAVP